MQQPPINFDFCKYKVGSMGRFKITDIDNESFYQIPKSLFTNENYKGLGLDAKVIYSFLKDRMELSRKNNWKDENGDIYLLFTQILEHKKRVIKIRC